MAGPGPAGAGAGGCPTDRVEQCGLVQHRIVGRCAALAHRTREGADRRGHLVLGREGDLLGAGAALQTQYGPVVGGGVKARSTVIRPSEPRSSYPEW